MRVDLMGSMPISRPLRPVRRDSGAAMSDLLGHVGRPLPALPPAGRRDDQADGDRDRPVEHRGGVAERAFDEWVLQDHLARNIAEKAPAQPDDPRVAVHETGEQPGAPDDDRQRQPDAEHDEREVAAGGGGDGQHVVEAHRHVGHDDDPDRVPERGAVLGVTAGDVFGVDQLHRDPDEERAAHELHERHTQQEAHDADEEETEDDGAAGTPDLAEDSLAPGQGPHGQRDDQRVVARQEQVEDTDAEQSCPELRIGEHGHGAQVSRGAGAAAGTPRSRRHHGVMTGSAKKKIATSVMAPAIGRVKKIASEPCDMMRLWRSAFSARSPSTRASTSGASGPSSFLNPYPMTPKISMYQMSIMLLCTAYAP